MLGRTKGSKNQRIEKSKNQSIGWGYEKGARGEGRCQAIHSMLLPATENEYCHTAARTAAQTVLKECGRTSINHVNLNPFGQPRILQFGESTACTKFIPQTPVRYAPQRPLDGSAAKVVFYAHWWHPSLFLFYFSFRILRV